MLKNYLKIALRSLLRQRGYAFINIFGLALGIVCCGLIGLYVHHELSYDRYHRDADRIYRLVREWEPIEGYDDLTLATVPPAVLPLLTQQFPHLKDVVSFARFGETAVRYNEKEFREDRLFYAQPAIFDIFSVPLLKGDPKTALNEPFSIVLSESTARKYFGDHNPVGETLVLNGDDAFRVTGVMMDTPGASHVHFDFLASWGSLLQWYGPSRWESWYNNFLYTYVRLAPEDVARIPELEAQFAKLMDKYEPEGNETNIRFQPLTSIHLHSALPNEIEQNGSIAIVRVFAIIAIVVLLIACINFVNLTTARGFERAKEVGVRKAVGAQRGQVIQQLLTESVVMAGAALVFGLALTWGLLPFFQDLSGMDVGLGIGFFGAFAALALLVGVGAGALPAFMLSGFRPVAVLNGKFVHTSRGAFLRNGLVIFQFAASVMLIAGTLVVHRQITFMQEKSLGFDDAHVLLVELPDNTLVMQGGTLAEAFERLSGVESTAFSSVPMPGNMQSSVSFYHPGTNDDASTGVNHRTMWVSDDFAGTMAIELLAGRFFREGMASDSAAIVVNETSARQLGYTDPSDAVGQMIEPAADSYGSYGRQRQIIGVVADFHVESVAAKIQPIGLILRNAPSSHLLVRLRPGNTATVLDGIRRTWAEVVGNRPLEYKFTDAAFDALYREQERAGQTITVFAILAVLIACLGLFGLATFTAQQRTKEIGIRKVLGASVAGVVALLSRKFLKLVGFAFLVATPVAFLAMERWLEGFAYRIEIGPSVFLLTGAIVLVIALVTVSYQSIKVAIADPVESLRYE